MDNYLCTRVQKEGVKFGLRVTFFDNRSPVVGKRNPEQKNLKIFYFFVGSSKIGISFAPLFRKVVANSVDLE